MTYEMSAENREYYETRPQAVKDAIDRYPIEYLYRDATDADNLWAIRSYLEPVDGDPVSQVTAFLLTDEAPGVDGPHTVCLDHLTLIPESHAHWIRLRDAAESHD